VRRNLLYRDKVLLHVPVESRNFTKFATISFMKIKLLVAPMGPGRLVLKAPRFECSRVQMCSTHCLLYFCVDSFLDAVDLSLSQALIVPVVESSLSLPIFVGNRTP
jgi:hypothetical protein